MIKRYELILNMYECGIEFSKKNIIKYVDELCKIIKMKKHGKIVLWKDSHNKIKKLRGGISALQFIKTSSITIHTFETGNTGFVNIFSCKDFDFNLAKKFSKDFFKCKKIKSRSLRD